MTGSALTAVLVLGAVGTLILRASFLLLIPGDRLPGWARRGLRFVAPAVLAALAVPAFVPSAAPQGDLGALARPLAGVVAALVAWRFRNVLLTIGCGMGVLWGLNFLL